MHLFGYKIKHKQEITYKNFIQEIASSQISEVQNPNASSSDDLQLPEMQPTPRGPKQDTQDRFSGNFSKHKLEKIVAGGDGK
jgi:hypothetical protein